MSHVFLIVLALHVLIIGGAFAFHWFRAESADKMAAAQEQAEPRKIAAAAPGEAEEAEEAEPGLMSEPVVDSSIEPGVQQHQMAVKMRGAPVLRDDEAVPAPDIENMQPMVAAPAKPAPVPQVATAEKQAAPAAGGSGVYAVAKGDTLHKIARQHGVSVTAILQANGLNSDMLKIGQKLQIPGASAKAAPAAQVASSAPAPVKPQAQAPAAQAQGSEKVYVVVKGDTLVKIARKYGTTAENLMQANNISDPSRLGIGQKLILPSQSSVSGDKSKKSDEERGAAREELAMNKN